MIEQNFLPFRDDDLPATEDLPKARIIAAPLGEIATEDRFAAVLTLDYGIQGRMEHSVVFFCSVWEELVDLLADPWRYLLEQQVKWDEGRSGNRLCWQLRRPVIAVIRPGKEQPRARRQFESFLGAKIASSQDRGFNEFLEEDGNPHSAIAAKIAADVDKGGAFFVEFAIDTNVMNVFYWLPSAGVRPPRFDKGFTQGVFGIVPGRPGMRSGTLHFDLKGDGQDAKPTPLHRAQFVVDCLESRQPIADELHKQVNIKYDHARLGRPSDGTFAKLEAEGEVLTDVIQAPPAHEDFPMIIMDNLSATGDPCYACCNLPLVETLVDGRHVFMMEDLEIKCYKVPQPCPPTE